MGDYERPGRRQMPGSFPPAPAIGGDSREVAEWLSAITGHYEHWHAEREADTAASIAAAFMAANPETKPTAPVVPRPRMASDVPDIADRVNRAMPTWNPPGSRRAELKPERKWCPDDGTCHHNCEVYPGRSCWRVHNAGPLSGVFPDDEWPRPLPERVGGFYREDSSLPAMTEEWRRKYEAVSERWREYGARAEDPLALDPYSPLPNLTRMTWPA